MAKTTYLIQLVIELDDADQYRRVYHHISPSITPLDVLMDFHLPGLRIVAGAMETTEDGVVVDREAIRGRTPAMHRHYGEHAHPGGGDRHYHERSQPFHFNFFEPVPDRSLADPAADEEEAAWRHDATGKTPRYVAPIEEPF